MSERRLRVYVAGSSDPQERARVVAAMTQVKGHPFMELALDWDAVIQENAGARNAGLDDETRHKLAEAALLAVVSSDVVWLLAPNSRTAGAWVEFGHAVIVGHNEIMMFASGPTKQSIFCSLAREFETDAEAFVALSLVANDVHHTMANEQA